MVFSSLLFLFGFLTLSLALYFIVPKSLKNPVLLFLSLFFYAWGEPVAVFLMIFALVVAYLLAFPIAKNRQTHPKTAKAWFLFSVIISLSILFFFKYYAFFASTVSLIPGITIPKIPWLKLPIGISFYTFQILSYTIDLYRGKIGLQKNLVSFGTYVTLFPQLIAGPIVRYSEIDRQLTERRVDLSSFSDGVSRFCVGLSKKVLLGDPLALSSEYFRNALLFERTPFAAWMTILLYTLHIYYDFSGYSDMAIGLGKLFGFDFPENFNYPYISKSITEFWRRWHMTLSSWFKEYVYIPLGGNRRGKAVQCRNIAVVWVLTGLWHGANLNFLFWGLYFCVLLIFEHLFFKKYLDKIPAVFSHFYTMFFVTLGFLIFSYTDLFAGWNCFLSLFGVGCKSLVNPQELYQMIRILPIFVISVLGCTPIPKRLFSIVCEKFPRAKYSVPVLCFSSLFFSVAYLVDGTFSPFEYLNF